MQTRSGSRYEASVGLSRNARRRSPRRVAKRSPATWMRVFSRLTRVNGPGFWFLPSAAATPGKVTAILPAQQPIAFTLRSGGACVTPSFVDSMAARAMPFGTSIQMETPQTTPVGGREPTIRIQWSRNNSTKRLERMQVETKCKTLNGRRLDFDTFVDQVDPSNAALASTALHRLPDVQVPRGWLENAFVSRDAAAKSGHLAGGSRRALGRSPA